MISTNYLDEYLERIGYSGHLIPDFDTLCKLQECHTQTIPFENLNPLFRIPVKLDAGSLRQKLIHEKRGGYCFEQNGFWKLELEAIGYRVIPLAARVFWNSSGDNIPPKTHMLLLVIIDGKNYISDVGFGGQVPTTPLLLEHGLIQQTKQEPYKFEQSGNYYSLQSLIRGEWRTLYRFNLDPVFPIDYILANWYTSTHPHSTFVNNLTASRVDSVYRYVLYNDQYNVHSITGYSEHKKLTSTDDIRQVLEKVMGIQLPEVENLESTLSKILRKD